MELLTFFRKNTKKWFVYSLIYLFLHAVSMSVSAEQIYFVHTDHINTPMMVTDQDQNVVWEGVRKPFGEMEEVVADIEQPIRFPGQYYDKETGLYYNLMRDYDPVIGRYIQSDPIGLAGGINTYGYAGANPIMAYDPNGEFIWLLPLFYAGGITAAEYWVTATLGALIGTVVYFDFIHDTGLPSKAANDDDCDPECNLVDAEVAPIEGGNEGNVVELDYIVTCVYYCPSMGWHLEQSHFIPGELSGVINSREKAMNWCPKTTKLYR